MSKVGAQCFIAGRREQQNQEKNKRHRPCFVIPHSRPMPASSYSPRQSLVVAQRSRPFSRPQGAREAVGVKSAASRFNVSPPFPPPRRPLRGRRRGFWGGLCRAGLALIATGVFSSLSWAHAPPPATSPARATAILAVQPHSLRPIHLSHVHGGESISLRLFDAKGKASRQDLKQLRAFLACHKTGVDHPIHWRVVSILLAVGHRWPGKTIKIYSGYRHPKVSHNSKRSKHTRGRAIDFRVQGVPNRVLFESLRASFSGIGVGYYPNSHFVHLDIRERDGLWVDYAAPGRRACYSPNARRDLQDGSAEKLNDRAARLRGCKGHDRRDLDRDSSSVAPPASKAAAPAQQKTKSTTQKSPDSRAKQHSGPVSPPPAKPNPKAKAPR